MSPSATRAFILGSGGFLGRQLLSEDDIRYIPLRVSRLRHETDLPRFEREVFNHLERHPQDAIVNCIGTREATSDTMNLLNTQIPKSLARVAKIYGTHVIHIGSAAETTKLAKNETGHAETIPPAMLAYGATKRAGTEACLSYENAAVLRVYNIHGLPHHSSSGLHQVCRSLRPVLDGNKPRSLINTTRDYVHLQNVRDALRAAVGMKSCGLIEVCSGFGISISEIIEGLPRGVRTSLADQLTPAHYFAPVIGPSTDLGASNKSTIVEALCIEVMTCASS